MSYQSFKSRITRDLIKNCDVVDVSGHPAVRPYDFAGVRGTVIDINLVAFVHADTLTGEEILKLHHQFLSFVQLSDWRKTPDFRNPNGLLCLCFEAGCSPSLVKFIQENCINHFGGIVVSWVLSFPTNTIHTHHIVVSKLPPVIIPRWMVFPGMSYLQDFMQKEQVSMDEFQQSLVEFLMFVGRFAVTELKERWSFRRKQASGAVVEVAVQPNGKIDEKELATVSETVGVSASDKQRIAALMEQYKDEWFNLNEDLLVVDRAERTGQKDAVEANRHRRKLQADIAEVAAKIEQYLKLTLNIEVSREQAL